MTSVVGREGELARLYEFAREASPAMVLIGVPGMGKTTLWQATVEVARVQGVRVLTTRPLGPPRSESPLPVAS